MDHVGIGADFDLDTPPVGFEEPDKFPNVTREMLNRGYSDEDVIKTLELNWVRVLREVLG